MDAVAARDAHRGWTDRSGALRTTVLPLSLMLLAPPFVLALWTTAVHYDGSIRAAFGDGPALFAALPRPSVTAAGMLIVWACLQWILLRALPGRVHLGPPTRQGNRPRYRLNGIAAFAITHAAFVAAVAGGWLRGATIYERWGEMLATASIVALVICGLLYLKGVRAPSSSDAGRSGNPIFDLFWGVELHPRAFGVSLKQWIACRVAMMGWSVAVLSFAFAQVERHGALSAGLAVAVALQIIYVFKFFVWESGYFDSLDMMHDRFGFYIAWGVLAWLPGVYPIASVFMVDHPSALSLPVAIVVLALGLTAIAVNYAADAQRQRVRATHGDTKVWGRAPELIRARYRTEDGTVRESLLLASGFWGLARHFHYLPELLVAIAWTLPAGTDRALPWFYVLFLAILLVDRAGRDDRRCATKYGSDWDEYRRRVPWRIVPGLH